MPALTHGRVKNGFNLLPRTITYAQGKCDNDLSSADQNKQEPPKWQNGYELCKGSQRALCCGRPGQYTSMIGQQLFRNARIPTGPANRKFASTVVVGRSFAAKRAIARRTASCTKVVNKQYPDDRSKDVMKCACLLPTVTYRQPVNAYSNPCAGGLLIQKSVCYKDIPTNSETPYQRNVQIN